MEIIKKVICINNGESEHLVLGKIYEVVRENSEYYYMRGVGGGYYKYRFKDVVNNDYKVELI